MGTALALAIELLRSVPLVVNAGLDLATFVKEKTEFLDKLKEQDRDPTDSEWEESNAEIEALRAKRPNVSGE